MTSSAQPAQADGSVVRSKGTRQTEKLVALVIFLLPATLVYLWLVILPVVRAIQYSMYDWNGFGPLVDFVGLQNYAAILDDRIFHVAIGNNGFILLLSLFVQLPLALGLATLLQSKLPGRAAFRLIFFMPYVVSEVITGLLFNYMFRTTAQGGLVNVALGAFGIDGPAWMGEPDLVMYAIFITLTWKYFGLYVVLFLAGLQNVPSELKEAARIDGASEWDVYRRVTLPLLRPTIVLTIYFSVIGSLQVFDLVWAMKGGGPVFQSETMATFMYRAGFLKQQIGYGNAVAVIIFLLAFTFSLLYQKYVMRRNLEGMH